MASYKVRLYITMEGRVDMLVNADSEDEALEIAQNTYGDDELVEITYEEVSDAEVLTSVNEEGEIQI